MPNEIKVTKCWTKSDASLPSTIYVMLLPISSEYQPAILMWREDYEALIKERDELRKRCRYNLDPGAQITCWDEYESLRARYDAMQKELEELREKVLGALEDGYMAGRENRRSLHEVKKEFKSTGKVEWFRCKDGGV